MNLKKNISTISYFDVDQKNGGAIFAKNMDVFLNSTDQFASLVYCNKRSQISEQYKENESVKVSNGNLVQRMKDSLKKSKTFEFLIHFLRNDLNAIILSFRLFFKNKIKKDTILLFHDHLSLFYFSFFFNLRNRKIVMIMHNNGSPIEMISSEIKNTTKRKVVNAISNFQIKSIVSKVDKIVFLCDNARFRFMELYNVNKQQTTTIPNGIKSFKIDHSKQNNNEKIRFITVCTMNERKGIDLFIKCLPVLNEKFASKISFTLIGQGPLLEELKHLSTLYTNLNVVGESSEVSDFLDKSDVFFLLSRNEGQPLSILEALRASLFVIATDVGCNSSMINDKNGLLIDVSEQSIVDAFSRVIIEWDSYKGKGENSLKLFNESFTEEKMYDSYLQIFNSL